jgi:hypothetical protein
MLEEVRRWVEGRISGSIEAEVGGCGEFFEEL